MYFYTACITALLVSPESKFDKVLSKRKPIRVRVGNLVAQRDFRDWINWLMPGLLLVILVKEQYAEGATCGCELH